MPFIPAPDAVKVCMRYRNAGQLSCNIFYVNVTDPITTALLNSIGAAFVNWYNTNLKSEQSNQVSLEAVEVTDASTAGGLGVEYVTGLPVSGTNTNGNLPQNSTVAIKWTTGLTGRSYRGRTYHIGLARDNTTNLGFLTSGAQTSIATAYNALITMLQGLTWPLVVASFHHLGVPRVAGVLTPIIAASINSALDSQRRRLPERGA